MLATDKKPTPQAAPSAPAPASTGSIWDAFRNEMDDLFDRFGSLTLLPTLRRSSGLLFQAPSGASLPACDLVEDEKSFRITLELPGLTEKDVELSISGDVLTVKGEKREEKEEKNQSYYLSERSYGSFQRSFQLPKAADREKVDAVFAKGVLTITLPKNAAAAPEQKKIEIKAS